MYFWINLIQNQKRSVLQIVYNFLNIALAYIIYYIHLTIVVTFEILLFSFRAVENSPPIVFRPIHRRRPPAHDPRDDQRSADAVPPVRRGPWTVARSHRSDGAHRSRVVRATEHDEPAERSARRSRRVDQGPEVPEHADLQHARRRADVHTDGAVRSRFHQTLQPRRVRVRLLSM